MTALDHLQAAGVTLRLDDSRLLATAPLTDELRQYARRHCAELMAALAPVDLTAEYRVALRLGAHVICATCSHYQPRPDARPDGWCRHLEEATWPRVPFDCPDHKVRQS